MHIRSISHKGLRRLVDDNDARGISSAFVPKLKKMIAFLEDMETPEELLDLPNWNAHKLTGTRKNVWSLAVSGNWRLTFQIDENCSEIFDLNLEDYH